MTISPAQCRAARALLDIDRQTLAAKSRVSHQLLADFETGKVAADSDTLSAITDALQTAGVVLIDDAANSAAGGMGVRLSVSTDGAGPLKEEVQYPEFLSPDASTGSGG